MNARNVLINTTKSCRKANTIQIKTLFTSPISVNRQLMHGTSIVQCDMSLILLPKTVEFSS